MKEAETLEYGKLAAKDYIPGAEVLPETSEVEAQEKDQGEECKLYCHIVVLSGFL